MSAPSSSRSTGPRAWLEAILRDRTATGGALLLVFFVLVAVAGPMLVGDPTALVGIPLQPPSVAHWLGTTGQGQDVLAQTVVGTRVSLAIGFAATFVSILVGLTWGSVAGFFGGRMDDVMMRIVDILYGLPYMFVVMILMTWAGRQVVFLFMGLGLVEWLTMSRIVRGQVISLKEKEFVEAARALGANTGRIIVRHILPNTLSFVIVAATISIPGYILGEVALSFLGVGIAEPTASWGNMLKQAQSIRVLTSFSWILAPGYAIFLTVLAFNFLGDGLRDALDPRKIK